MTAGSEILRDLSGGQTHSYQLDLQERQFVRIIVEQRGIDVIISLEDPNGKQISEIDSPNGVGGTEEIPYVAEQTGRFRFIVRSHDESVKAAQYLIRLDGPRPAGPQDASRSSGERAMSEGNRLTRQGKAEAMRQSIARFEDAARFYQEAGDLNKHGEALYGIATSMFVLGDVKKAAEALGPILDLARRIRDRSLEGRALGGLAAAAASMGDPRRAMEFNRQSLVIVREQKDVTNEVDILSNLGATHSLLGEYHEALESYRQAIDITRRTDPSTLTDEVRGQFRLSGAMALNNMCAVNSRLGELQEALSLCREAIPILHEFREATTEGRALANLALSYKRLGEPQRALDYNLQSVRILKEAGARRDEAIALNDLGLTYVDLREYQKAIASYEESLKLAQAVNNPAGESVTRSNLGVAYELIGEREKARLALTQSLEQARAAMSSETEVSALNMLGRLHYRAGDLQQAEGHFKQALELSRRVKLRPQEAIALFSLAQCHASSGDFPAALAEGEQSLALTESLRGKVADLALRSSYFATVQERYEFYLDTLARANEKTPDDRYIAAAFETNERARARALLDLLAEAKTDLRQGVDPPLLAQERLLGQKLNAKHFMQTRLLNGKHTDEQTAAIAKEIDDLNQQYQDLQGKIRASSPRYAAINVASPLTLTAAQALLDPETLLLEYAFGEKAGYLFVLSSGSARMYNLSPRGEIEALTKQIYDQLTTRQPRPESESGALAARLSRMLLGPAAAEFGDKRLVIVAAGALGYLPFAALPDPAAGKDGAPPLLAAHEIVYLPSASVLGSLRRELAQRRPAPETAAVFADPVFSNDDPRLGTMSRTKQRDIAPSSPLPDDLTAAVRDANASGTGVLSRLPFSRQEADALLSLAPEKASLRAINFDASRGTLSGADLSRYRILHFATHGLLDSERPQLSGLVLSLVDETGKPQDGYLRLHEIYNLKLGADLVTLSACQTALGKQIRGEGMVGLTRGFMYAGTPRVVATLWQVNDAATAELMRQFYRGMLRDGLRPAAALRAAQLNLLKQKRWASPYYWAPFVLQGEWR